MESTTLVERFRRFLLWTAAALCLGTSVELLLAEHWQEPIQFLPFALCGVGLAVIAAALWRPSRTTLLSLRGVMALLVAGSLFGVYEHIAANVAFELDIRPGAAVLSVLLEALTGAAPLLAPGVLALAGVLAIAATYYHPALGRTPATAADRATPERAG